MGGGFLLGLAFAVGTAFATNLAFLWKHRGAVAAPSVDMRHPIASAAQLFRSKWWAIGWAVAIGGWTCHVGALAFLPLSLAQAVISGGFVVLAVLAERVFGFHLGARQWLGIVLVAIGLGFLGATSRTSVQETRYSLLAIAGLQSGLLVVGVLLVLLTRTAAVHRYGSLAEDPTAIERPPDQEHPVTGGPPQAPVSAHGRHPNSYRLAGVMLGVAAGLAFGVSDMSIKALAQDVIDQVLNLISPWTATAVVASIGAFYASARSLQIGEGMAVITATTAAANLATIAGGIVVFGEPLGHSALEIALRTAAFMLVIIGAALMPGPLRAAEAAAEEEREELHEEREAQPERRISGRAVPSGAARSSRG